jgi:uncharacterized protein YbaA (DUF1428 family)
METGRTETPTNDTTTGFTPAATEEMVRLRNVAKAAEGVVAEWDEYNQPDVDAVGICHSVPDDDGPAMAELRRALTAALPHAKTEAKVQRETIEALALMFERGTLSEENSIKHDVPAVIRAQDCASLALLRAQKGKSDD